MRRFLNLMRCTFFGCAEEWRYSWTFKVYYRRCDSCGKGDTLGAAVPAAFVEVYPARAREWGIDKNLSHHAEPWWGS